MLPNRLLRILAMLLSLALMVTALWSIVRSLS
jgi:hypothetical protein